MNDRIVAKHVDMGDRPWRDDLPRSMRGKRIACRRFAKAVLMMAFLALFAGITSGGQIAVTWTFPSENEDGTALMDLAGAKVYYGLSRGQYTMSLTCPAVNRG